MSERHSFTDRRHAGRLLGDALRGLGIADDLLVLALPRGGVPVALEVARALDAPLELLIVRKLGVPGHEELAFGAVASTGARVINPDVVEAEGLSDDQIRAVVARELDEIRRHLADWQLDPRGPDMAGRPVVIVNDGLATGATMLVAIRMTRQQGASEVVAAIPVAPPTSLLRLDAAADRVVCLRAPVNFRGVGQVYDDFRQLTDDDVLTLLQRDAARGKRRQTVVAHPLPVADWPDFTRAFSAQHLGWLCRASSDAGERVRGRLEHVTYSAVDERLEVGIRGPDGGSLVLQRPVAIEPLRHPTDGDAGLIVRGIDNRIDLRFRVAAKPLEVNHVSQHEARHSELDQDSRHDSPFSRH